MSELQYQCCFCGEGVSSTGLDPCDLNILVNLEKKDRQHNQSFYCHLDCFEDRLHGTVKQHLYVRILGSDNPN